MHTLSTVVLTMILAISSLPVAAQSQATILVMGDSLSAGYGMDLSQSWPALLQKRLDQQLPGYRVVNASVSGDTTRTALGRLPQALAKHQPQIVIISLGGNDGLRGIPPSEMQSSISSMIALSRQHHAKVLLAGVRLPPNYGRVYIERFTRVYETVASDSGVPLVKHMLAGVAAKPELMQADGIHPAAAGQPLILDNIWPELLPLLTASVE